MVGTWKGIEQEFEKIILIWSNILISNPSTLNRVLKEMPRI